MIFGHPCRLLSTSIASDLHHVHLYIIHWPPPRALQSSLGTWIFQFAIHFQPNSCLHSRTSTTEEPPSANAKLTWTLKSICMDFEAGIELTDIQLTPLLGTNESSATLAPRFHEIGKIGPSAKACEFNLFCTPRVSRETDWNRNSNTKIVDW